jgi:hypothetical protein
MVQDEMHIPKVAQDQAHVLSIVQGEIHILLMVQDETHILSTPSHTESPPRVRRKEVLLKMITQGLSTTQPRYAEGYTGAYTQQLRSEANSVDRHNLDK